MTVENLKGNTDLSIKSGSLKQFSPIASATTLLNEAVYYVDAEVGTNYIPTTASGYMYLPGVSGNYASTPDAAALDITGDIDLRVKVAMDNWIPAADTAILAKYVGTGNQRSYLFMLNSDGTLRIQWSPDGSGVLQSSSTVATGIQNGATKWIRAVLDVNNGASGRDVFFYTSNDGITWTQLGTTITTSGTTSIFAGTAGLEIGTYAGGTLSPARGKIYRAQILNGIGGTTVFDANFETAMTSQTVASFTESSSNAATVTINRTTYNFQLDTIANLGTAGSLLPTTLGSSTAADSNDPKFLDFTGTNYVYLPGVANNFLSVPNSTSLQITGDIDLRVQVAMDDWTPSAASHLICRLSQTTNRSYSFFVNTNGTLTLGWSADGTNSNSATSSVAPTVTDGTTLWVRATLDVDNGASGRDIKFFTSNDGTTWTQLGTTVTQAGVTSIFAGTSQVEIGTRLGGTTEPLAGKVFRAQIFNGIDGTKVLDVDTSVITAGSATSFTAVTGQTVTINRSTSGRKTVAVTQPTWLFGTDDYMEVNNRYMSSGTYLYLPGVASNNASTPDSAALDITGDIDIRMKLAMDDWTPSATQRLICKRGDGSTQNSYDVYLETNGKLYLYWTTGGTDATGKTVPASVATGFADGQTKWIRITLDVDNGAGGNDVKFFASDDGVTWTQMGTTVTNTGTTSIFSGTSKLTIGTFSNDSSNPSRGKFFRAQVLNGIDGTVAFDANFETSITSLDQASFTESSANSATVTINRSGSAYRSAGITAAGYLYPGATNTFSASATDFLNFGASDSFTFLAVHRQWGTAASAVILGNRTIVTATVTPGYWLAVNTASGGVNRVYTGISGSVTSLAAGSNADTGWVNGVLNTHVATVNRSTNLLSLTKNAGTAATADISGITTSSTNFDPFRIGTLSPAASNYATMELVAVAVWRRRLLAPEIGAIYDYFTARD